MKLYHKEVYLPKKLVEDAQVLMRRAYRATPSFHLMEWLNSRDKKHEYTIRQINQALLYISKELPEPFEVATDDDHNVIKYVVRCPMDAENDIVVVITDSNLIKTCWINRKDDQHRTLNTDKYEKPLC